MKSPVYVVAGAAIFGALITNSSVALALAPQTAAQASAMTMSSATTLQAERADDPKAAPARHEGEGPFTKLVVRGVTLIDGTGGPPRGPVDIVIEGNRITSIAAAGTPGPGGATSESIATPHLTRTFRMCHTNHRRGIAIRRRQR